MEKIFIFLLAAASCFLPSLALADEKIHSPFVMPPSGKPDVSTLSMDLEGPTALAFDSRNRPYMFERREPEHFGYILTLRDGAWVRLNYLKALQAAFPEIIPPNKRYHQALGSIAIDGKDRLYAVIVAKTKGKLKRQWYLLYSENMGKRFQVTELPGMSFLETYTGHNDLDLPPAVGCLQKRKNHPARWTSYHDLKVFFPTKDENGLQLGKPVHVSADCFGVSNHSGGYSFAVTRNAKTHIVYAEIPEDGIGNPTYVATIDRRTMRVAARKFLANAPPMEVDVHSTPVITADNAGILHVLTGAHNNPFLYTQAISADTVNRGWSKPAPQTRDRQTYATLVCDSYGRLHSVYRQHGSLRYVYKSPNAPAWSKPVEIVKQPRDHRGYTIFYHRLFIDRADALYLSFTFRTQEKGLYPRVLAISDDNGKSLRLATTQDMQARVIRAEQSEESPADVGNMLTELGYR
jgi:hypothetical protein